MPIRSVDGLAPGAALAAIRKRVNELAARQAKLWKRDLRPGLAAAGIEITTVDECSQSELEKLGRYFERDIYPILTPLAVGPGQPFPYVSGLSLSLGVIALDPENDEERFARVKVPEGLDRFVPAGKKLVPLEAVIAHFLPMLFPGMEITERALFRVTRDADFEVSDDADDLLEAVEIELRQRRMGDVVRLELSSSASRAMRDRLVTGLGVQPNQVYEIEGLLDQADLWQLVGLDRPDLAHAPWTPVVPPRWARAKTPRGVFEELRRGDLIVHQPYDSFRASFESFAEAAANDPDVIAIKTTVYRTSDESKLVSALIECRRGREAVGLPPRAEGALRRAAQHRVVARDGAGGRARRARVPRPEDPREDDARRPARARRPPALRPHRDRQLQRLDRPDLRGPRALHGRRGDRGRRRRPLQLRDRVRAPAALPEAARRAVHDANAARGAHPRGRRRRGRRQDGADPPQAERARRPDDHRGAVRRLGGRGRDRHPGTVDLHAAPRRQGALRVDPRAVDRRPLPRAQPRLLVRRGRRRPPSTSAAPT